MCWSPASLAAAAAAAPAAPVDPATPLLFLGMDIVLRDFGSSLICWCAWRGMPSSPFLSLFSLMLWLWRGWLLCARQPPFLSAGPATPAPVPLFAVGLPPNPPVPKPLLKVNFSLSIPRTFLILKRPCSVLPPATPPPPPPNAPFSPPPPPPALPLSPPFSAPAVAEEE